jgi:hypothetical protein
MFECLTWCIIEALHGYYMSSFNGTDSPKDGGGETTKRSTGMAREKETRQTQTYLGGGD